MDLKKKHLKFQNILLEAKSLFEMTTRKIHFIKIKIINLYKLGKL